MIDAAVELEAHPIGGTRLTQQARGGGDHVVIVDHPGAVLGRAPILRQPYRHAQMATGEFEDLPAFQIGAQAEQLCLNVGAEGPPVRVFQIKVLGHQRRQRKRLILGGMEHPPQIRPQLRLVAGGLKTGECSGKLLGVDPFLPAQRLRELLQFQQRQRHDPRRQRCRLAVTIGQPQRPAQQRLHAFNAKFGQRLAVAGERRHDRV